MDRNLPVSSVHGSFQARILEWVAISFSRGSSRPRDRTRVSHLAGRRFTVWAIREANETVKDRLTLVFAMLLAIWSWSLSSLVYHSETQEEKHSQGLSSCCVEEKPQSLGYTDHFSRLAFPPLYPRGREILLGGHSTGHSCAALQFRPPPIYGWLSFQHQNIASTTK